MWVDIENTAWASLLARPGKPDAPCGVETPELLRLVGHDSTVAMRPYSPLIAHALPGAMISAD
jgi:hypothetical protein